MLPKLSALHHIGVGNGHQAQVEPSSQESKELLLFQENRNLIDGGHIADDEDLVNLYGAVQSELGDSSVCKRGLAAAGDLCPNELGSLKEASVHLQDPGSIHSFGQT